MSELNYLLGAEYIELYKLLKLTGLCESGGQAKQVIADSQVKVNGETETRKAFKVRSGCRIEYDAEVIIVS